MPTSLPVTMTTTHGPPASMHTVQSNRQSALYCRHTQHSHSPAVNQSSDREDVNHSTVNSTLRAGIDGCMEGRRVKSPAGFFFFVKGDDRAPSTGNNMQHAAVLLLDSMPAAHRELKL